MGKTSRRNRNRNGPNAPASEVPFELLDIIPGYVHLCNYVVIEPQVLQYINTLSGAARDAFVREWVGEKAWAVAHSTYHKFVTSLKEGKSEKQASQLAAEVGKSIVRSHWV